MRFAMKKQAALILMGLFFVLALLIPAFACAQIPSYFPSGESQQSAILYFRLENTPFLGREKRSLYFDTTSTFEKALVQALVDGPSAVYSRLIPMFPDGTKVLSTQGQGDILFVTFNDSLLDPYPDEHNLSSPEYREGEGRLRRTLAMSALSCTITENTSYAYVQVLVEGSAQISTSLRLPQSYYLLDSSTLPPPLSRDENSIMQPDDAVEILCQKWTVKDVQGMQGYIYGNDEKDALQNIPLLIGHTLSSGTVSYDGLSALVLLSATMQQPDGTSLSRTGWPLRLVFRDGLWLVQLETLTPIWSTP